MYEETLSLKFLERYNYKNKDKHYFVCIPVLTDFTSYRVKDAEFVFDTGANVSMINAETCLRLGYDSYHPISKVGVSGVNEVKGRNNILTYDIIETPGIMFGGRIIKGTKFARYNNLGGTNLLGLNILEYFSYYFDNDNRLIYLNRNPNPNIVDCYKATVNINISETVESGSGLGSLGKLSGIFKGR